MRQPRLLPACALTAPGRANSPQLYYFRACRGGTGLATHLMAGKADALPKCLLVRECRAFQVSVRGSRKSRDRTRTAEAGRPPLLSVAKDLQRASTEVVVKCSRGIKYSLR